MNWWCVQTEPQREQLVHLLLKRHGFEPYAPRIKHHGRIAWLFPTYVFVAAREQFYSVLWMPGVVRLLMSGDRPAHLGAEIIAELHQRESKDGFVKLPATGPQKGDQVRIIRGSFKGQIAICEGMRGKDRVRVLLELLGQVVPIVLPGKDILPVADQKRMRY